MKFTHRGKKFHWKDWTFVVLFTLLYIKSLVEISIYLNNLS
jgi:hypothetical protein